MCKTAVAKFVGIHADLAGKHGLVVDHNHATGKVRALLCHNCNLTLGRAKDNPNILLSCIDYLNKHNITRANKTQNEDYMKKLERKLSGK